MSPQNAAAMEELVGAIAFSQGANALNLLLVRCNYGQLREQMVAALLAQLEAESLDGPVHILRSGGVDIHDQIQSVTQDGPPGAVIVLVTATGADLDAVLVELNKRREEFRRNFRFPVVLWFTDEGYQRLSQLANDFESIVGGEAIAFGLSGDDLSQRLEDAAQAMFTALLKPDSSASFNKRLKEMTLGYLSADEVAIATSDLHAQAYAISPGLQAHIDFARGLNVAPVEAIALFQQCADHWATVGTPGASLKQGVALYYLGQASYFVIDKLKNQPRDGLIDDWAIGVRHAERTVRSDGPQYDFSARPTSQPLLESDQEPITWDIAVPPLEYCLAIFDQANRPDLVAVCVNRLERTLHRLQRWDALERLIQRALPLHQTYGTVSKLSQDYGFLADIALHREQWQEAAQLAQQALDLLEPKSQPPVMRSWWPILYRYLLAKAERALGNGDAATAQLQAAMAMGVMDRPTLYSAVLSLLRECLRDQGQYLEAFELKRERLSVERQYGLRAFIGAGRLRSQRVEQRPTVQSGRQTLEAIAPEIDSSGRYRDLEELLNRIAGTSHKLIVLHGDSGVGKSSLVNGGLVPALQAKALENRTNVPVVLRRYTNWERELSTALTSALGNQNPKSKIQNPEDPPLAPPKRGTGGPTPSPSQEGDRSVQNPKSKIQNSLLSTLQHCEGLSLRPVLIFDQFEEFFFANPDRVARRAFFQFIAECLELPSALKIVFSLREDYLHYLLEAKKLVRRSDLGDGSMARSQLEDILGQKTLYEIGNFSPEDAKAIIQRLTAGSRMGLEPGLVDALVADLARPLGEVRPIEMQIVGAQLQTEGIQSLSRYLLLGDEPKEELVSHYLQDVVNDCGEKYTQLAELVLYLLTDERGTRPLKSVSELQQELKPLLPHFVLLDEPFTQLSTSSKQETAIDTKDTQNLDNPKTLNGLGYVLHILCGSGLISYFPEEPEDRYQLVHDYVAETFRLRYDFRLHKKLIKVEEERGKLFQANQVLFEARRKARRLLRTTLGISVLTLLSIIIFSGIANQRAEVKKEKIILSAKIDQDSNYALQQFEFSQIDALITAIDASYELKDIIEINDSFADYPALTPLFALQKILNQINEKNRIDIGNSSVYWAGFSPDNQYFGVTSENGNVQIRRTTGDIVSSFEACEGKEAWSLSFLSINKFAVACAPVPSSKIGLIEIYNRSGQRISSWDGHKGGVGSIDFSSQNNILVSAGQDGYVRIWNESGQLLFEALSHKGPAYWVSMSPDGQKFVSVGEDGLAKVWNIDGQVLVNLVGHRGAATSADFCPDSESIVTTGDDGTAKIWNLNGDEIAEFSGHKGLVTNVNCFLNGDNVATAGDDGTIQIWNHLGQALFKLRGHQNRIWTVNVNTDEQQLISAGSDGTVRLWNLLGKELSSWQAHSGAVWSVSVSPDERYLASAGQNGVVSLWKSSGEKITDFKGHTDRAFWVNFDPRGQRIVSSGEDGMTRLWNLSGKELKIWSSCQGSAHVAKFSPDGKTIATSCSTGDVVLQNSVTGKITSRFKAHQTHVYSVSFSPDGQELASAGEDGNVGIWNLDGQKIHKFHAHKDVLWVDWRPNGESIVTAGREGIAKLWDKQGNHLSTFIGHQGGVTWAGFDPDGESIFTASRDGTVRRWDLSGRQISQFGGHFGGALSIGFLPITDLIVVSDEDGIIRLWSIEDLPQLISKGCSWLSNYFDENEEKDSVCLDQP
ncbi:MAG: hypothetical protein AAGD25_04245 [Cyanobacteria bacterium P01_F01_bin.150]